MVLLAPGSRVLEGRVRISRLLARGENANTWAAYEGEADVVVKEERRDLSPELSARYRREETLAGRLASPYLPPFVGAGALADGRGYFVVRAFPGITLEDHLQQQATISSRLRGVTLAVLRALAVIHAAGVVHRDLHPGNVWVVRAGTPSAVVLDLGAAWTADDDSITSTTGFLGTYRYSSPEQLFAAATVDGSTDLYAVGCWLYQGLTGVVPLAGPSPQATLSLRKAREAPPLCAAAGRTFTAETEAFVGRLLARNPRDRFASADHAESQLPKALA